MGDRLYFVYTSHYGRVPPERLRGAYSVVSCHSCHLMRNSAIYSCNFTRIYNRKGSRVSRLPLIIIGFCSVAYSRFGSELPAGQAGRQCLPTLGT